MKSMHIDTVWYYLFGEQSQGFLDCHDRIPMSYIDRTVMVLFFRKKENLPERNVLQQATQIRSEKWCLDTQHALQQWDGIPMGK